MAQSCILPERAKELREDLLKGRIGAEQITKLLPEEKQAVKAILEDIVAENLKIKVTSEEVAQINTLAKQIDKAQKAMGDNLGNPAKLQENMDFWTAKKKMEDYLGSKNPAPLLRILTGTVGRSAMLASVKSPLLNIGSNIEVGFTEALSRRISTGQLRGSDNKLAVDYVKMVNKIYQKTGYDISRMTSIADTGIGGERVLGEGVVHAQGPGKVRAIARNVSEDIVFKQLMGAPDVAFSAVHFADSANLNSLNMAKGNKAKGKAIMEDALRLEPLTPEGEIVRTQAILDAQTATWTNKTWASTVTQSLRKVFNDVSGDFRLGDNLFPFIKTPANVIATGMDYAGMGIPRAVPKIVRTINAIRKGEKVDRQVVQGISRDLTRAGLGITGALIIASQLDDDDFIGAYDPARAQIEQLRNSKYNSIRIGDKWISTAWFGPLAVPLTAMLYSRKYGQAGWKERVFQYGKGTVSSATDLPVISDIYDYVRGVAFKKNQTLNEMTGDTVDYLSNQLYSRLVPSFMSDIANASDPMQRQADSWLQSIQAKIPFLRNMLPAKRDVFGEEIRGESAISEITMGSRLKTDRENDIIKEINRVSLDTGKGISFTNWDKSTSQTLADFKAKKGEEVYREAKIKYGQRLKQLLNEELTKASYQSLSPEDKLKIINNLDSKVIKEIIKQY